VALDEQVEEHVCERDVVLGRVVDVGELPRVPAALVGALRDSGRMGDDEALLLGQVLFSEPLPDQFALFAQAMGCDPEGERVQQSADIFATTYTGCDDDVPLVFYEVVGGGHAWPCSPLADVLTGFQGYISFDIDATSDSWAFFEQHTLGR
jgi:poly(3-hydroxybutyrate) depolymerase